jgi:hypothetical protein
MGAAARCVDVAIGSPIGQENNGQIGARKSRKPLSFPSLRPLQNGLLGRFFATYRGNGQDLWIGVLR